MSTDIDDATAVAVDDILRRVRQVESIAEAAISQARAALRAADRVHGRLDEQKHRRAPRRGFDIRAAMLAVLRSGVADPAFVALCRAHPNGPPPDVRPSAADGRKMRPSMPLIAGCAGSPAALCADA